MSRTNTRDRKSPGDHRKVAGESITNRSALTNGSALLAHVDGRSRQARRWRDLFHGFTSRTDGRHEQLCRSLASLVVQRELLDSALARGEPVDVDQLIRLSSTISRTMTKLGLVAEAAPPVDATDVVIERLRASP